MAHHIGLSYLEYSEDVFNLFFKQGKRVFKAVKKKKNAFSSQVELDESATYI